MNNTSTKKEGSRIHIVELDKPEYKKIKMNCDCVIDKRLTEYPMIEEAFSTSHFSIVCGKMGQGKTSWVTNYVKHIARKCYETIYVFMPPNSRASIDNDIYGKNLPENQIFNTLDIDGLMKVYEELQEHSSNGFNSLLVIDDFQAQLKDPMIINILQKIITKMRHLRCSIFLLQQNFQALVKPLRELVSNIVCFNLGKSQMQKLFDEIVQLPKDQFDDLVKIAFVEKHDWILINLHKNRNIYRNFDLIMFE
jgi:hypothetical protein